jgi:ASC-1-like (ASCH) protein
MARVLHLNLYREFFAQIAAGTKQIECRRHTRYWRRRMEGRHYDVIHFRSGYATQAPEMLVEFLGVRSIRRWGKPHYVIRLGRILRIKRWRT